ncbi:hypothetical protein Tco_0053194 [Tanacetum coccineum]
MVKRDVEVEAVGKGVDEIDKLAELTDEMQLKQEDQGCVHASNELQLHVVHVRASRSCLVNDVPCIKQFNLLPNDLLHRLLTSQEHRFQVSVGLGRMMFIGFDYRNLALNGFSWI